MTYKKIAEIAGVSPSTVSKVMSGSKEISEETANRIRSLMKEYGFFPAKYYKSKLEDLSHTRIAILVSEIISIHYSSIVSEIVKILSNNNIFNNIYVTGFNKTNIQAIIQRLIDEGVTDGIIAIGISIPDHQNTIPTFFIFDGNSDKTSCLYSDLESGIFSIIDHLVSLGHNRIGFIGEYNTESKLKYFLEAARAHGLPIDDTNIYISDKRFEKSGMEAAEHFLTNGFTATAFVTAYDEIALGAISRFMSAGLQIPRDVSITGINDIPLSDCTGIPLTTLQIYHNDIYNIAVRSLLDLIFQSDIHMVHKIVIQPQLIVRQTTGPVPKSDSIS